MLSDEGDGIVGQYIAFARELDRQRRLHGTGAETVREAIRICRESGILDEYLAVRGKEVEDIMITLFDQEEVTRISLRAAQRAGRAEGRVQGRAEGIAEGKAEEHARMIERLRLAGASEELLAALK